MSHPYCHGCPQFGTGASCLRSLGIEYLHEPNQRDYMLSEFGEFYDGRRVHWKHDRGWTQDNKADSDPWTAVSAYDLAFEGIMCIGDGDDKWDTYVKFAVERFADLGLSVCTSSAYIAPFCIEYPGGFVTGFEEPMGIPFEQLSPPSVSMMGYNEYKQAAAKEKQLLAAVGVVLELDHSGRELEVREFAEFIDGSRIVFRSDRRLSSSEVDTANRWPFTNGYNVAMEAIVAVGQHYNEPIDYLAETQHALGQAGIAINREQIARASFRFEHGPTFARQLREQVYEFLSRQATGR